MIYFKAKDGRVKDIVSDCNSLSKCYDTTMQLLFASTSDTQEITKSLNAICSDIYQITENMLFSTKDLVGRGYEPDLILDTFPYVAAILKMMDALGESISKYEKYNNIAANVWKKEISYFSENFKKSTLGSTSNEFYKYFTGSTSVCGRSGVRTIYVITDVAKKIYEIDPSYEDPFGVTKKLRKNEVYLQCPKCNTSFRARDSKCPKCGTSKDEVVRLIKEKEAKEAAEREQRRKEAEAKAAEEARIRAKERAEWWKKNWLKVVITVIVIIVFFAFIKIYKTVEQNRLSSEIESILASGDSCVSVYAFDEAEEHYKQASELAGNTINIEERLAYAQTYLSQARKNADKEYNESLRKLKIFLDADDNTFNEYSNQCLDKMIQIYPDREETTYYKNMRK